MCILAVDPGMVNIGVAMSDTTCTIANPLTTVKHSSRDGDAKKIALLAEEFMVERIIVGQSLDEDGQPTYEGRRSGRLAAAIRHIIQIPVQLWDEHGSTQMAVNAQREMKVKRKQRRGHLDHLAAVVILQSYLDSMIDIHNETSL